MAILVTGAQGCIGAWVLKTLLEAGETPVAYDVAPDPWRLRMIVEPEALARVRFVVGDVTDQAALARAVTAHGVTRIIHLAALQIPLCHQDPARGALVNVVGTAAVFETARAHREVRRLVYASSAAVFGPPEAYPPGPLGDDAPCLPATHYGVYKVANEGTARLHWLEHGVPSVGLRPLTVYGPGRDFGVTADPTIAMKAAVLGRPFRIRWGGRSDFQYVGDVARSFVRAALAETDGARVYNVHGEVAEVGEVVELIRECVPGAKTLIAYDDTPLPIAPALDESALQRDLGPIPRTPLREGVRETIARFERLLREGRLDTRELEV